MRSWLRLPARAARLAVTVLPNTAGEDIRLALGLHDAVRVLVVNGSTGQLPPAVVPALLRALELGVVDVAVQEHSTILTGGTDAGVFALLGQAIARRSVQVTCVGVAPLSLVTWRGRQMDSGSQPESEAVPLEPHHTHFVLVKGSRWGDETPVLLNLAAALGTEASLAILIGGGEVACLEVLGHVRAARKVLVISGTGRLADDLDGIISNDVPAANASIREISSSGLIEVVELHSLGSLARKVKDGLT